MKKCLAVIAVSLFAFASTKAQDVTFGARTGANYNIMSISYDNDPDPKPDNPMGVGFHFDAYGNVMFMDMVGARLELGVSLRYTKQETEMSIANVSTKTTAKMNPWYFDIPLLFVYQPVDMFQIHIGPQFNFLMANKIDLETETTITTNGSTTRQTTSEEITGSDATEGMNAFEFALMGGFVYEHSSGFNVGLRYSRGLTTVTEDPQGFDDYWNMILLSVGATFGK